MSLKKILKYFIVYIDDVLNAFKQSTLFYRLSRIRNDNAYKQPQEVNLSPLFEY